MFDSFLVVTPNQILVFRTDTRSKNVGKLHAWATLHAIEKLKQGLDDPEQVTIQMRQSDPEKTPWVLSLRMRNFSSECVNLIIKLLKDEGMQSNKGFEQKRKILESEVTQSAYDGIEIDKLIGTIGEWESKLSVDRQAETASHLMALYNKVIEFYSAKNNEHESTKYLQKLKLMYSDPGLQSVLMQPTTPQQAQGSSQ